MLLAHRRVKIIDLGGGQFNRFCETNSELHRLCSGLPIEQVTKLVTDDQHLQNMFEGSLKKRADASQLVERFAITRRFYQYVQDILPKSDYQDGYYI